MNEALNNVTPIESKRPAPSATHVISYCLDGFAITSTIETTAPITDVVARLRQIGAEPQGTLKAAAVTTKADSCPNHPGRKLKASTARPGTFFCTAKDETGEYCKFKA